MERVSNTVLLDAQVFEKISNDTNKIVAEQFQYPVELLEYTLNDEQTFKTLFNIFQNAHKFKIASDSSMDDETYEYEKIPFLEAIEVARDKGLIKLNRITYSRYKTLLDLISYGILKKQLQNKTIQAKVDGITYNIPANKPLFMKSNIELKLASFSDLNILALNPLSISPIVDARL